MVLLPWSEDLYWQGIAKYPLEGLILTNLIEQGEYQISSSGNRNSYEKITEWQCSCQTTTKFCDNRYQPGPVVDTELLKSPLILL